MNTNRPRERCWGPLCFEGLEPRLLMSVAQDCPDPGAPALPVDAQVTAFEADPGQDWADPASLVQDDAELRRLGPTGWQVIEGAVPDENGCYHWESVDPPEGWYLFVAILGGGGDEGLAIHSEWTRVVPPAKLIFVAIPPFEFGGAFVCPWVSTTGTVFYSDLECGFWGIAGDDGRAYDPINLPAELCQEGLRVEFSGYIRVDMLSGNMCGWILELDHIALDDAEQDTILKSPVYAETMLMDDGDPGIDPSVGAACRTQWPRVLAKDAGDTVLPRAINTEPADAQDDAAQDRTTLVTRSDLLAMASRPDRDRPVEVRSFRFNDVSGGQSLDGGFSILGSLSPASGPACSPLMVSSWTTPTATNEN